MAQATCNYSRSHNFSNEALADAIGNADLALKAHEAEVKALKEKFKSRGLLTSLLTRDETQRIAANRRACSSAASGSPRQENCAFNSFANPSKFGNATESVTPKVRSSLHGLTTGGIDIVTL
jgi:hypothetical protein